MFQNTPSLGFPGGTVVKSPPADAGDMEYGKGNLQGWTYLTVEHFYKMEHCSQLVFHGTHCENTLFSF